MLKKVSKLFTGNIVAQILGFVLYPLFARLFTPEEFGLYGLFTSISVLTSIFVSGQYYMAVANPESDDEAVGLVILSSLLSLLISLFLALSVGLPLALNGILKLPWGFILLMPFYIFLYVSSESLRMFMVRKEKFGTSSLSLIVNRASSSLLKIAASNLKALGLILSDFCANLLSSMIGYRLLRPSHPHLRIQFLWETAKKYKTWPIYFSVCVFFQQLIFDLPILFIDHYFTKKELGYYVLLNKVSQQPIWIFAGVITTALLKDFVLLGRHADQEGFRFLKKVLGYGFIFSLACALGLCLIGPHVFRLIFPGNWDEVSLYLPYSSVLVVSRFMSATILCYLLARNLLAVAAIVRLLHCLLLTLSGSLFSTINFNLFIKSWLLADGVVELFLMVGTLIYLRVRK